MEPAPSDLCRIDASECLADEQRVNLPVYLRIKPHGTEEMSIKVLNETTIETNHAFRANKRATYTRVFGGSSSQKDLFDGTTAHLTRKFLDGANVMIFAYGVTSSGKTHTIMGSRADPGILPRSLEYIFESLKSNVTNTIPVQKPSKFDAVDRISIEEVDQLESLKSTLISKVKGSYDAFDQFIFSNTTSNDTLAPDLDGESPFPADASCSIWVSIYEIHNEVITDLFSTEPRDRRKALNIGQDSKSRTFIKDLTQVPVSSAAEAHALLQFARQNLAIASTKLNDNSSRSHMVFNLKMVHWGGSLAEPFVNQFVISDLAGSERQAKTGTSGMTLKQASAINNSLLVLGRCLESQRTKDKGIAAPFRDSKLTRMLNPFFEVGGYVTLIICINPGIHLQDETMETVRFSAIASEIVQNPIKAIDRFRHLRRLSLRPMFDDAGVENWQDAVNAAAERDGVAYLEVKASFFNDMARDILRAEKLLAANETEIQSLKERLKEIEISKENVKLMYQDKMQEQRDKFAEQRADLEELFQELRKTLVEDYENDIRTYKEKYSKYRDGYAKLSTYIKEKLWPEVCLFRERFGSLPEFPPKDGPQDEEVESKNTVKYWQDKLHDTEQEFRSLRTELDHRTDEVVILEKQLDEQKKFSLTLQVENQDSRREIAELVAQIEELNAELASTRNQLSDHGTLGRSRCDEGSTQFCGRTELEQRIVDLGNELRLRDERAEKFEDDIRSLQDEVKRLRESEEELKDREVLTAFKLRNARRAQKADYVTAPIKVDAKRLQKAPRGDKKFSVARDLSVISQRTEAEEFEKNLKTIHALGRQMQKLVKESRDNRKTLKALVEVNRPSDAICEPTEQLETEFRGRRLQKRHTRILRDYPQSEKAIRRLRSASSSRAELKVPPTIEKPRRRLRLDYEESSVFKQASKQPVRYSSPATTARRTRSSRKC